MATGSHPIVPSLPGRDLAGVYTIRQDVDYLEMLSAKMGQARDVVIIGGGFIGMEMADECRNGHLWHRRTPQYR